MADEEHFSLCWNNFNTNLSTGFHESLCRGDLVDVTLVAEGQMVKAHRLVLSVCSPLFREMFAAMQPNQQAFVVLPNITHSALEDLITFIYCGEVNVKNEALSTFISTAESLQIKGLTDNTDGQTKVEPNQEILHTAQVITVNAPAPPQQQATTAAPTVVRQQQQQTRTVSRPVAAAAAPVPPPAAKRVSRQQQPQPIVESETESGTEEVVQRVAPVQVATAIKRVATSISKPPTTVATVKRIKINAASTPTQQTIITAKKTTTQQAPQQQQKKPQEIVKTEPVFIELPTVSVEEEVEEEEEEEQIEHGEDAEDVPQEDEESYAKYEDSYFTINETTTTDNKNNTTASSAGANDTTQNTTGGGGASFTTVEETQGPTPRMIAARRQKEKLMKRPQKKLVRAQAAAAVSVADDDAALAEGQSSSDVVGSKKFYLSTPWATKCLVVNGYIYNCHSVKPNGTEYWRCHNYSKKSKDERCTARCTIHNSTIQSLSDERHTHPPHYDKIKKYKERMAKMEESQGVAVKTE